MNELTSENYYNGYRGWDFGLMFERLQKMELPDGLLQKIQEKSSAMVLVLGSATPDNLNHISKIDRLLRLGKVEQDTVVIVDVNKYPLAEHKKEMLWIEGKDGWTNTPKSTPEFPYPKFRLAQADMRELPFGDQSVDVVLSDYTFNYLTNLNDIEQSFKAISRVLGDDGIAVISIQGNEHYPFEQGKGQGSADDDVQIKNQGGVTVYCFPLRAYLKRAEQFGLRIQQLNAIGTDVCVLLTKRINRLQDKTT